MFLAIYMKGKHIHLNSPPLKCDMNHTMESMLGLGMLVIFTSALALNSQFLFLVSYFSSINMLWNN